MTRLTLLLLLVLLQPAPSPGFADWGELRDNGRRVATLQWEQTTDATSACVSNETGGRYVLITCVEGRRGWHYVHLPPEGPADGMYWPDESAEYWVTDQGPYARYGPFRLEWRYWVPRFWSD